MIGTYFSEQEKGLINEFGSEDTDSLRELYRQLLEKSKPKKSDRPSAKYLLIKNLDKKIFYIKDEDLRTFDNT